MRSRSVEEMETSILKMSQFQMTQDQRNFKTKDSNEEWKHSKMMICGNFTS